MTRIKMCIKLLTKLNLYFFRLPLQRSGLIVGRVGRFLGISRLSQKEWDTSPIGGAPRQSVFILVYTKI